MTFIILQSCDNVIFSTDIGIINEFAVIEDMIKVCENTGIIPLPNIHSEILSLMIIWYHVKKSDTITKKQITDFMNSNKNMLFKLISAADYLNASKLMDDTCEAIAEMIKGKETHKYIFKFKYILFRHMFIEVQTKSFDA